MIIPNLHERLMDYKTILMSLGRCAEVKNEIALEFLAAFDKVSYKYLIMLDNNQDDFKDLRQELYIEILELIDKWDETRNEDPNNFFTKCIYIFCLEYIRNKTRRKKHVISVADLSDLEIEVETMADYNDIIQFSDEFAQFSDLYDFEELFKYFTEEEREILMYIVDFIHENTGCYKRLFSLSNYLQEKYQLSSQRTRYYIDCVFVCLRENAYKFVTPPKLQKESLIEKDYILKKMLDCVSEGDADKFLSLFSRVRILFPYIRDKHYE